MCVCLLVQHLHRQQRKQVCFHRWRAMRPRAAHSTSDRPPLPRASAELCGDGANPSMHAAGWEDGEGRDTAGRLQSGSRARRGEAGSSYTVQNKSPQTGLRQKESVWRNERTKQAVCARTSLATTFSASQIYIKQSWTARSIRHTQRYRG